MAVPQNAYRAVVGQTDRPNIIFIRLKSIDMVVTLREIYTSIASLCWISNLPNLSIGIETSLRVRADGTINALGDIFDYETGKMIAGVLKEDKSGFRSTNEIMKSSIEGKDGFVTYIDIAGLPLLN